MPKKKLHISFNTLQSAQEAMNLLGKGTSDWYERIETATINGQVKYLVEVNGKEYDILFNEPTSGYLKLIPGANYDYATAKQSFIAREHNIDDEEKAINGWTSPRFQSESKDSLRKATEDYFGIRQIESDNQIKSTEYHQKRIAYENLKGTLLQPEQLERKHNNF